SSEVRRHLRSCASCRGQFGRLVRLIHQVAEAPLPPVPPAARDRLLAQLEPRTASIPPATPMTPSIPVAIPFPQTNPPSWRRWGQLAAAALLSISLGRGLAILVKPRPDNVQARKDPPESAKPLEERVLERHLELAESSEPQQRLTSLNAMASD